MFKKVVVADNIAPYVTYIFDHHSELNGSTILLGIFLFAFQVYGDFSGYSDIAIGVARLFGFNLTQNFAFPYFSRSISEFWRRWHISLSTWIRDYVYIPLGGSRVAISRQILNVFIVFVISGFWHGANWTFIVWGALNALYFIPSVWKQKNKSTHSLNSTPELREFLPILGTFSLIAISLVFFRVENISQAVGVFSRLFQASLFSIPEILPLFTITVLLIFIGIEWHGRTAQYATQNFLPKASKYVRYACYYAMMAMIFYSSGTPQDYIYFQF